MPISWLCLIAAIVLVHSTDSMSYNPRHLFEFIDTFKDKGIIVEFGPRTVRNDLPNSVADEQRSARITTSEAIE